MDFYGRVKEAGNQLNWVTASEENNDYFRLMHSRNGNDFSEITRMDGNGTSTSIHEYDFIHENPKVGTNYYQLIQVDYDGTSSKSEIISLFNEKILPVVYPTPTKNKLHIHIDETSLAEEIIISIFDVNGKLVIQERIAQGENTLDLSELNVGHYFYDILEDGVKVMSGKVVKVD